MTGYHKLLAAAALVGLLLIGAGALWLHAAHPWFFDAVMYVISGALALSIAGAAALGMLYAFNHARWQAFTARHAADLKRAEVQVAPLAQNLHMHHENHMLPAAEQLALPAPPLTVVQPLDRWLDWADAQPHILLGGRTKAGKTTTATAILARRLRNRETVFIIDPHSSDWLGLPTAGRISVDGELSRALGAVLHEYLDRMVAREAHKARTGRELPHDHFGRMTVLIDECNVIADLLSVEWQTFTKHVASGSRKVGISLLLLAQSPLVEDLKISGGMRENFARLALDDRTVGQLIDGCRDKDRKAALNAALIGLDFPAAATIGAQVWLLDREGLDRILEPADSHALVWPGWNYDAGMATPQATTQATAPRTMVAYGKPDGSLMVASGNQATTASGRARDVSPDAARAAALYLAGKSPSEIVCELRGVRSNEGRRYQSAVDEIHTLIRQALGGNQ